jgi:cbb3-type cytochrome c oxidase subunit III
MTARRIAIALAAILAPTALGAQTLPEGVTPPMIETGAKLFRGQGLCAACHGPDGKGVVGPNLTDTLWLHGTGGYEEIIRLITDGVPQDRAKSGTMMPPRGGSRLSDAEVKAVAAYVWSLSRRSP